MIVQEISKEIVIFRDKRYKNASTVFFDEIKKLGGLEPNSKKEEVNNVTANLYFAIEFTSTVQNVAQT